MASINKNFVIKNGLEVDSKTLYVDANTNRVGIGSTIPTKDLDVVGDAAVQGTITTPSIVVGVATAGTVGVSTLTATSITGTAATITSVTCQSFTVVGSSAIGNGAEDEIALNGEITTNIIPDADSILDFGYFNRRWRDIHLGRNINASTLVGFGLSVGVGTARSYVAKELVISGFSTFTSGPVVVGSGTSTGTVLQPLQVTGGAYVSGSVGLGTTNPTSKLHVIGDTLITGVSTATTFNGNINAGVGTITSVTGTTATYTNGDFAVLDGDVFFSNTGIITSLTGTKAKYTTVDGDTFFSNTGIVTSLTGTKAKYTTLDGNTLFSNTGIVTTISGTTAKYTTLDGDVFFSNTGIVTTISGTTATYTNGDFAVLDGNSLFSNTGIITSLTGTKAKYTTLDGDVFFSNTGIITSLTGTKAKYTTLDGDVFFSNTGIVTTISGTTATYTNGDFAVLDGNSLFSNTGIVTSLTGTKAKYTTLDGDVFFSNTGIVTTISGTTATYTNGDFAVLDGNSLFSNTGIITSLTGTNLNFSGLSTVSLLTGTTANFIGVGTFGSLSIGATSVISSDRQLQNIASLDSTTLSVIAAGVAASPNNFVNLTVIGISTFINGPILVGSVTPTGTASQSLQVTGGAYVSGNTGIGTTNPTSKLHIVGDTLVTGVSTATTFNGNINAGVGTITSVTGATATYTNGDFAVLDGATTYANVGVVTTISGTNLNYTGVGTITRLNATNLSVTGVSTFTNGPVFIGAATSTGTVSQPLQVTGGAYVSGNVGIGTTNPLNQLHLSSTTPVIRFTETDAAADNGTWTTGPNFGQTFNWQALTDAGAGGGNYFRMTRSAQQIQTFEGLNSGNTWFTVDNLNRDVYLNPGNLGIGTTTPATSLHLYATTGAGGIYIEDSSASQAAPLIRLNGKRSDGNTSLAFSGRIVFDGQRTDAAVGANKALGGLIFGGNYDTTPNYAYSSSITSIAESAWTGVNTCPSALVFYTSGIGKTNTDAANVNFGTERMRISSSGDVLVGSATSTGTVSQPLQVTGGAYVSGNLGLGITNPTSKLHIVGDTLVTGVSTATSIVVGSGVTINASGINAGVGIITATKFSTGADGAAINIEATRITGPTELIIDPQNIADNTGRVRIKGDLFVDGSQFVVNSGTIELADFVVGIATTVTSNAVLDGAGIAIGNSSITSKTLTYSFGSSALKSSENFDLLTGKTYKINGTDVLSSTTLGSAVVNSSLTSVGTLTALTVSGTLNASTTLQIGGVSVTATAAELNILDGVTSTAAELNLVDGSVAGTIVNSKAVIYGAAGQVNATTLQIGGVSVIDSNRRFFGDTTNRNFFAGGAGNTTTTGTDNVFIGNIAGCCNTTGSFNNFIGYLAGCRNTFGCHNNFFGNCAGYCNTTGCYNNFFGLGAGLFNTTGSFNNFFGANVGRYNTTGSCNNFFGLNAGFCNTTGVDNIFIGPNAGVCNTTGSCNNFFGSSTGYCNTTGSNNTFIGPNAGRSNTIGTNNNFFGSSAGCSNTTGSNNNFIGLNAGRSNTTGSCNNFIGLNAGLNNISGCHNNFFGPAAGCCSTTGSFNNFFGLSAGQFNTTGSCNNFFGPAAGCSNTTGVNNIFIGPNAGLNNTTGNNNNFFGINAGCCNTTGGYNNFFGPAAGCSNTTGVNNIFIGPNAGLNNTIGTNNNFFGINAGCCNTTGVNNIFIGPNAGCRNTTGNNNNFFGSGAGCCNTTGSFNNFFGLSAGCSNTTGIRNTYIGLGAGCNNTIGTGNVVIGGNSRGTSTATIANEVTIDSGTNIARFQGAATAWTFTSDQRDKTNIIDLPLGSDFLVKLRPRKFDWNFRHTNNDKGKEAAGFIAQEVLEVIQEFDANYTGIVDTNDPNQYTLGAASLIPVMVNAIKELIQEVEDLKERVSVLE